jgi:recombination protein RecT
MTALPLTADTCPSCRGVHGQPTDWPTCPAHGHWLYVLRTPDTGNPGWTYACHAWKCAYTHTQPERATMTTAIQPVAGKQKSDQLVGWLRGQQDELAMAAASHIKPSTIVRIVQGALRKDPKLMAAAIANPLSLLHCCLDAARLGHEPGTDQYYLVPFGSEVTGIEGYKGIIERMFRAGAVSAVVAEIVHERDIYHRQGATTPPVHEFDEFADPADRGPMRGAYAYAVMLDGRHSKIIAMGRAEIMKHKAASRGSDRADSPWQKWEESMWKKTPLRGLEPYVPTSSEWLTVRAQAAAQARTAAQVTGFTAPADDNGRPALTEPVVDAEIVDEPAPHGRRGRAVTTAARPPVPKDKDHQRRLAQDPETLRAAIRAHLDRLSIVDDEERDIWVARLLHKDTAVLAELGTADLAEALQALESCDDTAQLHTRAGDTP